MNTSTWQVVVQQDPDTQELVLPLPQDLLDLKGWQEGDFLEWTNNEDGAWTLTKV